MKGVAKQWRPAQIAVMAAQAGCDLLCLCSDHDAQVEGIEGLIRARRGGRDPLQGGRGRGEAHPRG